MKSFTKNTDMTVVSLLVMVMLLLMSVAHASILSRQVQEEEDDVEGNLFCDDAAEDWAFSWWFELGLMTGFFEQVLYFLFLPFVYGYVGLQCTIFGLFLGFDNCCVLDFAKNTTINGTAMDL